MPRRKETKRGKRKGGRRRGKWSPQEGTSSVLSGPRVMPDETDVRLQFRAMDTLLNAGSGVQYKEWQANGAYDVDPALGSTETFGFDEWASLYSYYRVIGYDYVITVSNLEAFSVNTYVINSNVAPSGTGGSFLNMSSLPYNQGKLLAPKGSPGCSHTFRGKIRISKLLGSMAVETEDNFRALTTSVPADIIWCTAIAEANGAFLLGNGVVYDLKLTMHIRFYGRELDLALAGTSTKVARKVERLQEYKSSRVLLELEKTKKKKN